MYIKLITFQKLANKNDSDTDVLLLALYGTRKKQRDSSYIAARKHVRKMREVTNTSPRARNARPESAGTLCARLPAAEKFKECRRHGGAG